jgi:hypothetical protein
MFSYACDETLLMPLAIHLPTGWWALGCAVTAACRGCVQTRTSGDDSLRERQARLYRYRRAPRSIPRVSLENIRKQMEKHRRCCEGWS